jgi:hypothetical protein
MCLKYYMLPAVAVTLKIRRRGRSELGIRAELRKLAGKVTGKSGTLLQPLSDVIVPVLHRVLVTYDVMQIQNKINSVGDKDYDLYFQGLDERVAIVDFLQSLKGKTKHEEINNVFEIFAEKLNHREVSDI